MKITRLLLALVLLLGLAACERKPKTTAEKVKDKVDDALDRRSNEKLRDAAEEVQEGAKQVAKELEEAEKEIAKELEATPQKPGK